MGQRGSKTDWGKSGDGQKSFRIIAYQCEAQVYLPRRPGFPVGLARKFAASLLWCHLVQPSPSGYATTLCSGFHWTYSSNLAGFADICQLLLQIAVCNHPILHMIGL